MPDSSHQSEVPPVDLVYRQAFSTRLWHWINAALAIGLFMSGLMIFNAHPRLYWGDAGAHYDPAWLEIGAERDSGYIRIFGASATTTGILGYSENDQGEYVPRAFPAWATLPAYQDLAQARRWHFGFAWPFAAGMLFFVIWSLLNGHFRRDLMPNQGEFRPRNVLKEIVGHARFRLPRSEKVQQYNSLQKLAYIVIIGIVLPLLIVTGLCMSPMVNAAMPWLLDLLGGRQSARSLHFVAAFSLAAFLAVHIVMILIAGPANELRSMITGWFHVRKEQDR